MSIAQAYAPNLTLLSKAGVALTDFAPETEVADSLLHRAALETSSIKSPFSYYIAERQAFRLLRLNSGSLLFTAVPSRRSAQLSECGLYLLDCRFPCRIIVRDAAEYDILHFAGPGLAYFYRRLPQDEVLWQIPPALSRSGELSPLFGKAQADPVLCHMLLTRTLSRLALEHALPEKRIPPYLADMKARLEAHYCENCALADLERRYHVNRYRLCREFKLHYQTSPLQYLHKMRVQAAITLLTQTPMKVHEISYEVGYENVNHFIAHFKKNIGMTPTEYRQQGLPFPADL